MTVPYWTDHDVTLYRGDAATVLANLDTGSVNCVATSPPYYGLRDYGVAGQLGLEASPAEYVETMRPVFADVRRVLADDGVLWLNIGDSYYSGRGNPGPNSDDEKQAARRGWVRPVDRPGQSWAAPKNLLGIPWRIAFALQDNGWFLRNAVIWSKPNAMPESVTDRLSTRYEHVFLFSKSRRYWFDLDAIREPHVTADRPLVPRGPQPEPGRWAAGGGAGNRHRSSDAAGIGRGDGGRNPGDVWTIPTSPYPGAHFACFPPELARRCILAGCPQDGTVLDPFAGSGTTLMVARRLGRNSVGIDLCAEYLDLAIERIGHPVLDFDTAPDPAPSSGAVSAESAQGVLL